MGKPHHNPQQQLHEDALLITRYCDGLLSLAEFDALNDRLASDPALRRLFIDLTIQAEHLETVVTRPEAVFDEFAYVPPPGDNAKASARMALQAASYLIREAMSNRAAARGLALAAAVVLLALTLTLVVIFSGGDQPGSDPVTESIEQPIQLIQPIAKPAVVASLTATHRVRWAGKPVATGDALHAGQWLILTAGFAEITTTRGAVVIVEAPATIQLLDNDNALRLQTGKLVGICETPTSKGFLVRTPHMDITDLGTRFGVNTNRQVTQTHVFEGAVAVHAAMTQDPAGSKRLVTGQAASASTHAPAISAIPFNPDRFALLLFNTVQLPGTGHSLRIDDIDPNWQIIAIDGQPLDQPQPVRVTAADSYNLYFPNDPATSQWLSYHPDTKPGPDDYITYTFQTRISLPEQADPARIRLHLKYQADNMVSAIVVNGQRIEMPDASVTTVFDRWNEYAIDEHLRAGDNTIAFEVRNLGIPLAENEQRFATNLVGIRLTWQLETDILGLEGLR